MLMAKTKVLNDTEKCELINALALARVNNSRHETECRNDAEAAQHGAVKSGLLSSADRYKMWGELDERLIEAIRNGKLVILDDDEVEA